MYPEALSANPVFHFHFAKASEAFSPLMQDLLSSSLMQAEFTAAVQLLRKRGFKVLRFLLQGWCDARAPAEPKRDVTGADLIHRTHHRSVGREIASFFGDVMIDRDRVGMPGVGALVPLDAPLNLPNQRFSFEVQRVVAEAAGRGSFDATVAQIEEYTGAGMAKRQAEEVAHSAGIDFDDFYEDRVAKESDASAKGQLLVLTMDGNGVVMRPEGLRPATQKAAAEARPKFEKEEE